MQASVRGTRYTRQTTKLMIHSTGRFIESKFSDHICSDYLICIWSHSEGMPLQPKLSINHQVN